MACLNGRLDVIKLLLGEEVEVADGHGRTVKYKIDKPIGDIGRGQGPFDKYMNTPLFCAVKNYHGRLGVDILQFLIEKKTDVRELKSGCNMSILHWVAWHECLQPTSPITDFLLKEWEDESTRADCTTFASDPTNESQVKLCPLDIAALKVWKTIKSVNVNERKRCLGVG